MLTPITQACKHMKIHTRLTNFSVSKQRGIILISHLSRYMYNGANTKNYDTIVQLWTRENSSLHSTWRFLRLETARVIPVHVVKVTRNGMILVLYFASSNAAMRTRRNKSRGATGGHMEWMEERNAREQIVCKSKRENAWLEKAANFSRPLKF